MPVDDSELAQIVADNELAQAALTYASLGWHVFPVFEPLPAGGCSCGIATCASIGKHPRTENGLLDASADPRVIIAWWVLYPNANIGVALGASGLVALDVDHPDGPDAADRKWVALEARLGDAPPTLVQRSGSGSFHVLFADPGHPLVGTIQPENITVRNAGNYIIAAPSLHRSGGRYEWLTDDEIAEMSSAWSQALRRPERELDDAGMPSEAEEPAALAAVSAEDRLRRMREHLARETGERMGVDPQGMTKSIARTCVRGFAVRDLDAVLEALVEYGQRCTPPYSEERLREYIFFAANTAHDPEWGASLSREVLAEGLRAQAERLFPRDELAERRALDAISERLTAAIDAASRSRSSDPDSIARRERLRALDTAMPLEDDGRLARTVADVVAVAAGAGITDEDAVVTACRSLGNPGLVRELVRGLAAASANAPVAAEPEPEDDAELRTLLSKSEEGDVLPGAHNLLQILRFSEDLKGHLHFDLVTKEVSITSPAIEAAAGCEVTALRAHVNKRWGPSFKTSDVKDTLGLIAKTYGSHDPLAEYLSSVRWDGQPRIGGSACWSHRDEEDRYREGDTPSVGWLVNYCRASVVDLGGEDVASYIADVGAKWLISAVARALDPGCKADTVLVLEGSQGRKKSTVFDVLGGQWFFDGKLDLGGDKDALQVIQSVWIVELAELASLARTGTSDQKQFLSKRRDFFRAPYDAVPLWWKRRCVFAGSVNPEIDGSVDYLADKENRRWWAARVLDDADIGRLKDDRDQLLAEAVHRYRRGERWWFTREEQATADHVAEHRQEKSAWTGVLREWASLAVQGKAGVISGATADRWRLQDIARGALGIEMKDLDRSKKKITSALREAGFIQSRTNRGNVWSHPEFSVPGAPTREERHN